MNTPNTICPCLFGLGLLLATLSGCSGSAVGGGVATVGQNRSEYQATPTVQPPVADPAQNAVDTSTASDKDNGQPGHIDAKIEEAPPAYQWPNPDRSEIFLPPPRKPATAAAAKQDERGVALIGFAKVDRKHVLLEIDGVIAPTAEGDSRGKLQVVAINPPEVTLKRGDREWTVKLFDTP